jgi:hypothetical protein
MVTKSTAFPSKYLCHENLQGRSVVVIVDHVAVELLGVGADQKERYVAYFKGKSKGLVLNLTNWDAIESLCGKDFVLE